MSNNINASIVDQRVNGLVDQYSAQLPDGDIDKKKSAAFVLLCISTCLDLSIETSLELLTEGGNDAGVDGIHIGEVEDGEFLVTLFQGKYKRKLTGDAHFPENGVQKAVLTVNTLFDPAKEVMLNPLIRPKIEEIRSLVRDGYIPNVRSLLCNNGQRWNSQGQQWIDQSGIAADQVVWKYFNHDTIVDVLRKTQVVNDSLRFSGDAIIEAFNFRRVLIGKVQVAEIAALFNRHHDAILERNIRRYLGLHANRVNSAIHDTLLDVNKRDDFYFFNNGITIICKKFRHNALQGAQGANYQVKLENMQIINGGQTGKTIQQTLNDVDMEDAFKNSQVLVRVYELAEEDTSFVQDITYATNSQNPVDLRDLRSNDKVQKQLELSIKALGYSYKRQKEAGATGSEVITSAVTAEAVLAIWREMPHQAKFRRKEHFGKLYDAIFVNLNGAQALVAVSVFRFVENRRKGAVTGDVVPFLPYSSHYLAMLMGRLLLAEVGQAVDELSHRNFQQLDSLLQECGDLFYQQAIEKISQALIVLYGDREVSLQQLSATFRRGDLLEML